MSVFNLLFGPRTPQNPSNASWDNNTPSPTSQNQNPQLGSSDPSAQPGSGIINRGIGSPFPNNNDNNNNNNRNQNRGNIPARWLNDTAARNAQGVYANGVGGEPSSNVLSQRNISFNNNTNEISGDVLNVYGDDTSGKPTQGDTGVTTTTTTNNNNNINSNFGRKPSVGTGNVSPPLRFNTPSLGMNVGKPGGSVGNISTHAQGTDIPSTGSNGIRMGPGVGTPPKGSNVNSRLIRANSASGLQGVLNPNSGYSTLRGPTGYDPRGRSIVKSRGLGGSLRGSNEIVTGRVGGSPAPAQDPNRISIGAGVAGSLQRSSVIVTGRVRGGPAQDPNKISIGIGVDGAIKGSNEISTREVIDTRPQAQDPNEISIAAGGDGPQKRLNRVSNRLGGFKSLGGQTPGRFENSTSPDGDVPQQPVMPGTPGVLLGTYTGIDYRGGYGDYGNYVYGVYDVDVDDVDDVVVDDAQNNRDEREIERKKKGKQVNEKVREKVRQRVRGQVERFAKRVVERAGRAAARLGAKIARQTASLLSKLLKFLAEPHVLFIVVVIIIVILLIWLIVNALQSTQTAASIERIELYMGGSSDVALNKFYIIIGKPEGDSYNQDSAVWRNAFEVDGPNGEFVKAINHIQATFQFKNSTSSGTKDIKEVELKISLPISSFRISNFDTNASPGLHISKNVNNIIIICKVSDNCKPYNENTFKFSIKFDGEGLNLSDLNYVMQIFYTVSNVTFMNDKTADLSMNGIRLCLGLISKGNISVVPCNVVANLVRTDGRNSNTNANNAGNPNIVDVGGSFLCPFDVTQLPYMICTSGYFDTRSGNLHQAIDIAPQRVRGNQISIYSPVSGEVIYVYPKNLVPFRGGNLIKIKDERTGYIYTLAHLQNEKIPLIGTIDITVGTKVTRGQFLGVLFEPNNNTSANWSTGAHLHFSIQKPNDTYIDPLPLFKAYCRLNDNFKCLR